MEIIKISDPEPRLWATSLHGFFKSLPKDVLSQYGRFEDPEECLEIMPKIVDGTELGFVIINSDDIFKPGIRGYAHLGLFKQKRRNGQASFGIVVHPDIQGKEWGKRLMLYVIAAAEALNLDKIWLHVWSDNVPAIQLYTRMGFVVEGIFIRDQMIDNIWKDVISMAKFL